MQYFFKKKQVSRFLGSAVFVLFTVHLLMIFPVLAAEEPGFAASSDSGRISGILWCDALLSDEQSINNYNGLQDAEESPVASFTVSLFHAHDKENALQTTATNANGEYVFSNLSPGAYIVGIENGSADGVEYLVPSAGATVHNRFIKSDQNTAWAFSDTITIENATDITGINGGLCPFACEAGKGLSTPNQQNASISGMLWLDKNQDGIFNSAETAITAYPVYLYRAADTNSPLAQTQTDSTGAYTFSTLAPDNYIVGVKAQENGTPYLLPLSDTIGDNRFRLDTLTNTQALTKSITLFENQLVSEINAGMRTMPQIMSTTATIVDNGTGIIVGTETEFRTALANTHYTTIYLGADITMNSRFTGIAKRSNGLIIDGYTPENQTTRHKYTSGTTNDNFQGTETNITFRNIELNIRNYYGIYRPTSTSAVFTVTLDNATGIASQFFYGNGYSTGNLTVRNSDLTVKNNNSQSGEFAEYLNMLRFEGKVTVTKQSTTNSMFYRCNELLVAQGADVILNRVSSASSSLYSIFWSCRAITIENNAAFHVFSPRGFVDSGDLTNVNIGEDDDVKFICTASSGYNDATLSMSSLSIGNNSSFLLYDRQTSASNAALNVTTLTLDNPKQFIVLNPNGNAFSTSNTALNATNIGSIGYYYPGTIDGIYNSAAYEYTGTEADYSKWWAQTQLFNVSASTWSNTNPANVSTTYSAGFIPSLLPPGAQTPEQSITGGASGNFALYQSNQTAYGVVIKGIHSSSLTVSNTISGVYADLTKEFTYTIYLKDSGGAALPAGTILHYTGGIVPGLGTSPPENGTLTLDADGAATFQLQHGQAVSIVGIDANGKIRIVETPDSNYAPSFLDSEDSSPTTGNDTGVRIMAATDRSFDFTNDRYSVVPTGISAGDSHGLLLMLPLLLTAAVIFFAAMRRHTKEARHE
jgi:hypothetical protein